MTLKQAKQQLLLFAFGSTSYAGIELLWRKRTHWTMAVTGGICFCTLYKVYEKVGQLSLWKKCALGSSIITGIEFAAGCIINLKFGLGVWDYSKTPLNVLGQICLPYSALWGLLCIPIVQLSALIQKITK